jgi:hypothetical protein
MTQTTNNDANLDSYRAAKVEKMRRVIEVMRAMRSLPEFNAKTDYMPADLVAMGLPAGVVEYFFGEFPSCRGCLLLTVFGIAWGVEARSEYEGPWSRDIMEQVRAKMAAA